MPFAPKDLRSSFITFLLSDANSRTSALKKAVAQDLKWPSRLKVPNLLDGDARYLAPHGAGSRLGRPL